MLVRILRDTVAGGRPVTVGEVVDVSDGDARTLFALRKAERADQPPDDKPPVMPTEAPETATLVATEHAVHPAARPRARPRKDSQL
jgi:hypothetical protein